ncbi:MAG: cation acetate symporter [Roseiflexus sp.]|uniref:sodium:solute symporter family protein n=1 Tax=Roseiflexus sp. TaxID=2562120 RepID=UPI0025FF235C|nr:sodium:solute symporter family protein [Roseiflexus sp.]MCL6541512.1 cation acetate symporter [Roseiflexus sp.]
MAVNEAVKLRNNRLAQYYGLFTIGLIVFSLIMGALELGANMPKAWIGWTFLMLTMGMYAFIGIVSRTKVLDEYYVAGRNVPAVFNGMATGADWMSAASFISMAGTLYALGYDGLAYIMGWTGGYVLLALLFAPYIRKFGQYTIPDFVGTRYGGRWPRLVAAICAIIVSLTYVTAQVVGVGIIMSRFIGVPYEWGVVIGLSGVLVCSFLGGMKAVTWTQVAQYIILIIAYMIPVTFLSLKLTGFPMPQLSYGQALDNITRLESEMKISAQAPARDGSGRVIQSGYVPAYNEGLSNAAAVTAINQINTYFGVNITPPAAQSIPNTGKPADEIQTDWRGTPWNFLALTFCLMVGTAGLPHILIRFYTVPSVRESRLSVGWALFFIFLLYFTAPAYAAFARWEILQNVVGKEISSLPEWTQNWSRLGLITQRDYTVLNGRDVNNLPAWAAPQVKSGALVITDANGNGKIDVAGATFSETEVDGKKIGVFGELSGTAITKTSVDGILQFGELNIDPDTIVLATPEIAGLPYTVAALIAAGGMAAALSTADGLLVVISSAIAHDVYYRIVNPKASMNTRIWLGKTMLVVAAVIAALLALPRLALIAQMVAWAFSMAASSFFPVILLGIFWKRCNGPGAIAGMVGGLSVTLFYMYSNYVDPSFNVLGITHLAAGIFGMPVNFLLCYIVSKLTAAPSKDVQDLVDHLRSPELDDDLMTDIASGKQAAGAR